MSRARKKENLPRREKQVLKTDVRSEKKNNVCFPVSEKKQTACYVTKGRRTGQGKLPLFLPPLPSLYLLPPGPEEPGLRRRRKGLTKGLAQVTKESTLCLLLFLVGHLAPLRWFSVWFILCGANMWVNIGLDARIREEFDWANAHPEEMCLIMEEYHGIYCENADLGN